MADHSRDARASFTFVPIWILAFVGATLFLREARTLFVPIALAALAAYALQPTLQWFDRLRLPRTASAAMVVGFVAATVMWTGWVLSDDFRRMASDLPQQMREIRREIERSPTGEALEDLNTAAAEMEGDDESPASGQTQGPASGGSSDDADADGVALPTGTLANYLWQGSTNLFAGVGHVVVVTFLTYFLLVGAPHWRRRLIDLSGSVLSSRRTGAEVLDEITHQVQRFLLMRVVTALAVAMATWGVLLFFGAPAPGLWAAAAGVFNWVPYLGPIIVSGGLAIVGFVGGGLEMALELSLSALVITSLEGWLLTPFLLGRAARVNTLAVFLGILFWSWVWGIWGTILAVPLTSVIKAVSDHVERLDWLSLLLSEDRPRDHA